MTKEEQQAQARRQAAAREARQLLLERSVLSLAACGYSEAEISAELAKQNSGLSGRLGTVSVAEVRRIVKRAKEAAAREVADAGAEVLLADLLLLKELRRSLAPAALKGGLGAAKELREVLTLRAKIHGWIVEKQEIAPLTAAQIERLKAALRDPGLTEEERAKLKADLVSGDAAKVSAALTRLRVS